MELRRAMYAWTPAASHRRTAGEVRVGPHPDETGWTDDYECCLGACDLSFSEMTDEQRIINMFVVFHAMVVDDGILPDIAHEAFLEIDEYRQHIIPTIDGADVVNSKF